MHVNDEQPPADFGTSTCSRCGGTTVPIAYGYPGHEMMEASERGEIVLGGCMVSEGQPTRRCQDCGAHLGSRRLRRG